MGRVSPITLEPRHWKAIHDAALDVRARQEEPLVAFVQRGEPKARRRLPSVRDVDDLLQLSWRMLREGPALFDIPKGTPNPETRADARRAALAILDAAGLSDPELTRLLRGDDAAAISGAARRFASNATAYASATRAEFDGVRRRAMVLSTVSGSRFKFIGRREGYGIYEATLDAPRRGQRYLASVAIAGNASLDAIPVVVRIKRLSGDGPDEVPFLRIGIGDPVMPGSLGEGEYLWYGRVHTGVSILIFPPGNPPVGRDRPLAQAVVYDAVAQIRASLVRQVPPPTAVAAAQSPASPSRGRPARGMDTKGPTRGRPADRDMAPRGDRGAHHREATARRGRVREPDGVRGAGQTADGNGGPARPYGRRGKFGI